MKFGNYPKTNISVSLESGSVMVSAGAAVQGRGLSRGRTRAIPGGLGPVTADSLPGIPSSLAVCSYQRIPVRPNHSNSG